jgi:hypothetical protein
MTKMDRTKFLQGRVSDEIWTAFLHLVELCQAFRHWQNEELKQAVKQDNSKLAANSAFQQLEFLCKTALHREEESTDFLFAVALTKACRPNGEKPENCDFGVLAFSEFDAAVELNGLPYQTARRWRARLRNSSSP